MAAEGQHKASVEIGATTTNANKNIRDSQKEINRLTQEVEKANRALAKKGKGLDDTGSSLQRFGKGLLAGKDALVGYTAAAVGVFYAIDRAAARTRDFADATANLRYDLAELTEAVDHGATQFQLAGAAADIQSTALRLSQEQVNELFAAVDQTAAAHKRDFIPALEATTKAIAKGNVDRLKGLGLQVDMKTALDREAVALGKTTKELSFAERQSVAFNEVMRAMNAELGTQTKAADGLAFSWERVTNKLIDAGDNTLLLLNELPGRIDAAATSVGLLDRSVEDLDASLKENEKGWTSWFTQLSPLSGEDWLPLKTLRGMSDALDDITSKTAEGGIGDALRKGVDAINEARQAEVDAYTAFVGGMHADAWLAESRRLDEVSTKIVEKEEARKKRRGGKRDNRSELERQLEGFEPMGGSDDPTGELFGRGTPADPFEGGADKAYLDRAVEVERMKNDALLEEKLRALEVEREMGVDPFDQIEREEAALLEHNDFLLEATQDDMERMRLHDDRRRIVHQAHLSRIAKEREAERRKVADMAAWTNTSAGLLGMQTQTAEMAANVGIKNAERRAKFVNRARGIEALGIGAFEVVQAAVAAASLNIPQTLLHAAAAAVAFTQGGLLLSGAMDQRAGGGGGGGISGASFRAGGGGGGGAANGPSGAGSSGRSEGITGQINSSVPASPNPTAPTAAANSSSSSQGGQVINFNAPVYAISSADEVAGALQRTFKNDSRNHRRSA